MDSKIWEEKNELKCLLKSRSQKTSTGTTRRFLGNDYMNPRLQSDLLVTYVHTQVMKHWEINSVSANSNQP